MRFDRSSKRSLGGYPPMNKEWIRFLVITPLQALSPPDGQTETKRGKESNEGEKDSTHGQIFFGIHPSIVRKISEGTTLTITWTVYW